MLNSLRLPKSLLVDSNTEYDEEDIDEEEIDEEEEGEENESEPLEDNEIHVDVKPAKLNLDGSAEEIASKFTAKELKDMCKNKGLSCTGDKKAMASRLLEINDNITMTS